MKLIFAALLTLSFSAEADMFKCKDAAGKIAYQDAPCTTATIAKLKRDTTVGDPNVVAKRQAEAEQFNKRYTARLEAEVAEAEKRRIAANEQRQVAAAERNARAQEDQAEALREQAAALAGARAGRARLLPSTGVKMYGR
jgi:Domain of unknown function (DUF4124)